MPNQYSFVDIAKKSDKNEQPESDVATTPDAPRKTPGAAILDVAKKPGDSNYTQVEFASPQSPSAT